MTYLTQLKTLSKEKLSQGTRRLGYKAMSWCDGGLRAPPGG